MVLSDSVSWSCLPAITSFFCDLTPQLGTWQAAVNLHISLLSAVLRLPLTFYDITPTGRILARFSKDIDVLDNTLPMTVSELVYCFYEVGRRTRCILMFPDAWCVGLSIAISFYD